MTADLQRTRADIEKPQPDEANRSVAHWIGRRKCVPHAARVESLGLTNGVFLSYSLRA